MSDQDSELIVAAAWDQELRYFDTAPHYGLGLSEIRLGKALKRYNRDDYEISTKVGRLLVEDPKGEIRLDDQGFAVETSKRRIWDFSRDGIFRSVEESLKRLDLDRIDTLLLHDPDDHFEQASTEGIAALIELREQKVVSKVGAGMNAAAPLAELIRRADVDVVMCAGRLTLLEHDALEDLVPLAIEQNVGILAAGVFNSGILGSKRASANSNYGYAAAPDELINRANHIAEICEAHGVDLPTAAVAYAKKNVAVSSVVLGARTPEQVRQNSERFKANVPEDLWIELQSEKLVF
ncbi:MAG: hypothetical protein RL319_885 [Actinomycetota bacterium]|jgi:D-threo-aldose 1-dehydrogenase